MRGYGGFRGPPLPVTSVAIDRSFVDRRRQGRDPRRALGQGGAAAADRRSSHSGRLAVVTFGANPSPFVRHVLGPIKG